MCAQPLTGYKIIIALLVRQFKINDLVYGFFSLEIG